MSSRTYSSQSIPNERFLKNFSSHFYLFSRISARNLLESKPPMKYFHISFCWRCLTRGLKTTLIEGDYDAVIQLWVHINGYSSDPYILRLAQWTIAAIKKYSFYTSLWLFMNFNHTYATVIRWNQLLIKRNFYDFCFFFGLFERKIK